MNTQEMLDRLVDNALDFLSRSMAELDEQPKFSVIHFFTAVELFLKARLLAEHWSLVVSKAQIPDLNRFQAGDFLSVSLEEASEKLEKVVGSGLTTKELETFKKLRGHRNKMVHFFHEAHSVDKNTKLRQDIATEQLTGWYMLHRLLSTRWAAVFSNWSTAFHTHDKNLRKLEEYLRVVFKQVSPEIDKRRVAGAVFLDCPSCGFCSYEHSPNFGVMYRSECLVCRLSEDKCIRIVCPDCGKPVVFVNEGFGSCDGCGRAFEPDDLTNELFDHAEAHIAAMDGDDSYEPGNCSDCDGYHTVVHLGDAYLCTSCFGIFDSLEYCEWCGEPNTGDMEYSLWAGCSVCDGKAGQEKDD